MSAPTPARRTAYEVLRRVFEHGAWADRALRSAADRHKLDERDRHQAQHLAYGAVQRRGTTDYVIAELSDRRVSKIDPPLLAALRLGTFELLFAGAAADHAAVDQAVELAKGGRGGGRRHRGSGLVNAVMRRVAREGSGMLEELDASTPDGASIAHSMPLWIAELWFSERGSQQAVAMMEAANRPPIRSYRLSDPDADPGSVVEGAIPAPAAPAGVAMIELPRGAGAAVEAAVAAGTLIPQSPGSALAAALLAVQSGERVLDLCAAPGIKTTQLAAAAGPEGSVTAVEQDEGRASELRDLCARGGAGNVTIVTGDARVADIGAGYDRVLVDAPCTGLGTLASRPDARWRRRPADVGELAGLQRELLDRGLGALRPGGRVLYSVCTISRAEGEAVVNPALAAHGNVEAVDLAADPGLVEYAEPGAPGALQLIPGVHGAGEGFFISALQKDGSDA